MITRVYLNFRWRLRLLALAVAAPALVACATSTVMVTVPPRVELTNYPTIGVIDVVAQPPGELGVDATQKFIGNLQSAQPGLRVLELGSQEKLIKEVGFTELDHRAICAIGAKYRVAAVLTGTIALSEVRPDIKISTGLSSIANNLSSISAKAKVDGRMSAKLWETASGATTWSNSSWGSWTVAGMSLNSDGTLSAGYHYPKEKQDQIIMSLIKALNGDFWPSYERRAVER